MTKIEERPTHHYGAQEDSLSGRIRHYFPGATEDEFLVARGRAYDLRLKHYGREGDLTDKEVRAVVRSVMGDYWTSTCRDCGYIGFLRDFCVRWRYRRTSGSEYWAVLPQCRECYNARCRERHINNMKYKPYERKKKATAERRRERVQNDPVLQERERAGYRVRNNRKRRRRQEELKAMPKRLPAEPLREWMLGRLKYYEEAQLDRNHNRSRGRGMTLMEKVTGISVRALSRFLYEGQENVSIDWADQILTRDGTCHLKHLYPDA